MTLQTFYFCYPPIQIKDAALLRKNLVQLKFLKGTRQSLLLDHLLSAITLMTLMLDQNFATTLFAVSLSLHVVTRGDTSQIIRLKRIVNFRILELFFFPCGNNTYGLKPNRLTSKKVVVYSEVLQRNAKWA